MDITVRMNSAEAITAISSGTLLVLIEAVHAAEHSPEAKDAKTPEVKAQKPVPTVAMKSTEELKEAQTENADVKEEIKAEVKPPVADGPPEITLEQVRAKLAELSKIGKQDQVKVLLVSYGAKKLSDVSKEKYAELLEKACKI